MNAPHVRDCPSLGLMVFTVRRVRLDTNWTDVPLPITAAVRVPRKHTRTRPGQIAALTANPESPPMAPLAIRSVLRESNDPSLLLTYDLYR